MSFPITFTGQMAFQNNGDSAVVTNFIKLFEKDLEMAHANRVLNSFSIEKNTVTFKPLSIARRHLSHPLGYLSLYFYPRNYREFILSIATLSSGKVSVTSDLQSIVVVYTLDFSEVFKWALYGFAALLFFGSFALAWETRLPILLAGVGFLIVFIFGFYTLGQVVPFIFLFRRYLKKRMDESQKGIILFDGRRKGNE
jgi:hypothetical protein